jgi:hypothetical protein
VHRALRRLAAPLVVAPVLFLLGRAGTTWGASSEAHAALRPAHRFEASLLATVRDAPERAESAVVLVVLDGVRWQDVFSGADRALAHEPRATELAWTNPRMLMPNLYAAIDRHGVAIGAPGRGAEVAVGSPALVSLPGYLELFAGHPDSVCRTNECRRPPARTIADDVADSSGAADVAIVSSWSTIARAASADPSRFMVTAGRARVEHADELLAFSGVAPLVEEGARARAWPGEGDYRPDVITSRIALRLLEAAQPRFLFVGLGDADEYAHHGDYRGYLDAIHGSDSFLGQLGATLGRMGARGLHTTVVVTTDHGRASDFSDHGWRYPEARRIWLVASGDDVRAHGFVAAARRYTLSDIAPTVRALLGITRGEGAPIAEIAGP